MLSKNDLEKLDWYFDEDQIRENDGANTVAAILGLGEIEVEPAGALLAASPRLALACQSAVALADLIEAAEPGIGRAVRLAALALGREARQALAQAGCAAGAGDE